MIKKRIKAVLFDLGNTLIEFGPNQLAYQFKKLDQELKSMFGHCDEDLIKTIRNRQITAPYSNGYKENNLQSLFKELIRGIYQLDPSEDHIETLIRIHYDSFIHSVELPNGVLSLLNKLGRKYRLGLISNYPCARSITDSLANIGILSIFETVVISANVGYVKPHVKPFKIIVSEMDLKPSECVYIGDNWLADIQGSKRIGMYAIHTNQYAPYKIFKPTAGDHESDARITHINELEDLLL
jgi:putative hydrolase of the HAD superfamily